MNAINSIYVIPDSGKIKAVCPVCNKNFKATRAWVYKAHFGRVKKLVCSHGCQTAQERINEERKASRKHANTKNKPVRCIETGVVYRSIFEASLGSNCSTNCISRCCSGRQKESQGLHWEYAVGGAEA